MTINDVKAKRAEYLEFLKQAIVRDDARFVKNTTALPAQEMPRHPQGETVWTDDREGWWLDHLWCGDATITTYPEEFFGEEYAYEGFEEEGFDWLNEVFDEAWRAVMPADMHHIIEG